MSTASDFSHLHQQMLATNMCVQNTCASAEDLKVKMQRHPIFTGNNELHRPNLETVAPKEELRNYLLPVMPQLQPEECNEMLLKRFAEMNSVHLKTENTGEDVKLRPYRCDVCAKTFLLKHHLTTHARTHSGIKPHSCLYCGKSFTHKHCLNTHLLLHSSDRPYRCAECKKSFTLKHHLLTHAKVHSRDRPFVCEECGLRFPSKRHLVTHAKFHAGERPFLCEECGESFAQKEHLVMHSRFHGFLDSFVCGDCGAAFSRKFELVNHEKLHGKQPLTCTTCGKEFLQKRTLMAHIRNHSTNPALSCLQCGETFDSRSDLVEHAKTHPSPTRKPHGCHECGSTFDSVEALVLHTKLHSGDPSILNDICTLSAGLHSSHPLNHHHLSHATVKSKLHVCGHCSKPFTAKHGLQQHQRRHPDGQCSVRSHVCGVCGKGFFQKNHLLLHQRQHVDLGKEGARVNVADYLKVKMGEQAVVESEERNGRGSLQDVCDSNV